MDGKEVGFTVRLFREGETYVAHVPELRYFLLRRHGSGNAAEHQGRRRGISEHG